MSDTSLTSRTARALKWSFSVGFLTSIFRFTTTAIIAHYLAPSIFGLFNMAMIVIQSMQVFSNLGVNAAIMQKPNFDKLDISTAFFVNTITAFIAFIIASLLSFPAGSFYSNQQVTPVILALSCTLIIPIISGMNGVLLRKNLRYARLEFCGVSATIVHCVVILICAIHFKMGVWSLVVGLISWYVVDTISQRFLGPWSPKLAFDRDRFKALFSVGRNMFATHVLTYLTRNLDFIIIGHNLGPHPLGLYQMAYNLPHMIHTQIAFPAAGVLTPAMCVTQGDGQRIKHALLRAFRIIALLTFPVGIGLALVSDDFIATIYGKEWIGALNSLRILCGCALIRSLSSIIMSPLLAMGRTDLLLKWNVTTILVSFPLLLIGSYFGITTVALAMFLTACVDFLFYKLVLSIIDIPLRDLLRATKPVLASCLIMVTVVVGSKKGLEIFPEILAWERLIFFIVLGISSYTLSVWFLFPSLRKEALEALNESFINKKDFL